MTLGELITDIERLLQGSPHDPSVYVLYEYTICNPRSYRMYYDHLAFELSTGKDPKATASTILVMLKDCVGKTFEGWKGGDYVMKRSTPVFVAPWGSPGSLIIGTELVQPYENQPDADWIRIVVDLDATLDM